VPYDGLAAEVTTGIRLLRAIQAELASHAAAREQHYRQADPGSSPGRCLASPRSAPRSWSPAWAARPVPGRDPVHVLCRAGPPRQRDRRDRPQGPADEQGRAVPAAVSVRPRRWHRPPPGPAAGQDLLPADDRARRHPPEGLLRRRRAPRQRAWAVLSRGTPYVVCGSNGNPVTPAEATKIIADKWTVPENIRKRRRSRKTAGKAPQTASTRPGKRGDPPRPRSSRSPAKAVSPVT
jgi:hypothetical protein